MKDYKKKRNILIFGIVILIIALIGVAYAFFSYSRSAPAFSLNSNGIRAEFTEGNNEIDFKNAYPISDSYALSHLNQLSYIDFTISGEVDNIDEAVAYEIYLTEKSGNTLNSNYVKVYLTNEWDSVVSGPSIYGSLDNTTYQTDADIGKVIFKDTVKESFSRKYRLYVWLDSEYSQNEVSKTFSFYVNLYAYNDSSDGLPTLQSINYIEDLVDLSNEVNSGTSYNGTTFILERDLDFNDQNSYLDSTTIEYGDINGDGIVETLIAELTNTCASCDGFIPIGKSSSVSFEGSFDGKNHTISNLYQKNINHEGVLGLFGAIKNSNINNLSVNGNINVVKLQDAGGIIGRIYGKTTINNCHNSANITSNFQSSSIGGIVGVINETSKEVEINNSSNSGNLTNSNNAGGLVGFSNGLLTIENSFNEGNVTNTMGQNIGGLLGRDDLTTSSTNIINSYNTGEVTGNYQTLNNAKNIGGLIGKITGNSTIKNSYNNNSVTLNNSTVEYPSDIGGLIGYTNGDIVIENSYNSGNVTGGEHVGGILGMNQKNTILYKSYNTGTVYSDSHNNSENKADCGGLIGITYTDNSNTKILNSFNSGDVNGYYNAGGLLANLIQGNTVIVNSYNAGNVSATENVSSGLSSISNSITSSKINNFYNIGTLNSSWKIGISYVQSETASKISLSNAYYLNSATTGVDGETSLNSNTTAMNLNDMKSNTFVNTLNANVNNINLSSIDSSLGEYSLSTWKLGSQGYPVFDWLEE